MKCNPVYNAKSVSKSLSCADCQNLLIFSLNAPEFLFDQSEVVSTEAMATKNQFLQQINRGGLTTPSDLCFLTCIYAWNLFVLLKDNKNLKSKMFNSENPLKTFCSAFCLQLQNDPFASILYDQKCQSDHQFSDFIKQISSKMFKIMTKNVVKEMNEKVCAGKKRNNSTDNSNCTRKVTKLSSAS